MASATRQSAIASSAAPTTGSETGSDSAEQAARVQAGERAARRGGGGDGRAARTGHPVAGDGAAGEACRQPRRVRARRHAGDLVERELAGGRGDQRGPAAASAEPAVERERARAAERAQAGRGAEQ